MTERTLVVLKPDVVERNLIGTIVQLLEQARLKIVEMDMRVVDSQFAARHYPDAMAETIGRKSEQGGQRVDDYVAQGLEVLHATRAYLSRGPVVALVVEGDNAVRRVRELIGYTDPTEAKKGTIRGDYGVDSMREANRERRAVENLVHASGTAEEAESEIELWFGAKRGRS